MINSSRPSTSGPFSDATTSSQQATTHLQQMMYPTTTTGDDVVSSLHEESNHFSTSLLCNLSILQDKVHQIQSLISLLIATDHNHHHHHLESSSMAIASIGTSVQEIISAASSMAFTCQQLALTSGISTSIHNNNSNKYSSNNHNPELHGHQHHPVRASDMEFSQPGIDPDLHNYIHDYIFQENKIEGWHVSSYSRNNTHNLDCYSNYGNSNPKRSEDISSSTYNSERKREVMGGKNYDIVELDAADLLAKYTHYCQICGKGFKRDANLRMHMRAHGDEYKTLEALTNPLKRGDQQNDQKGSRTSQKKKLYYSCPHEGCRWNRRHEKFQPLKSIICVKNHYKRSHCPKMYICKKCDVKQFSVLSDLRTHEKHCGDVKWVCSCGTRFSRKDKLMGHVGLFVGHAPADQTVVVMKQNVKGEEQMKLDDG